MRIPKDIYDQVLEHAREDAPNECCGLIGGKDGEARTVYRARNVAVPPSPNATSLIGINTSFCTTCLVRCVSASKLLMLSFGAASVLLLTATSPSLSLKLRLEGHIHFSGVQSFQCIQISLAEAGVLVGNGIHQVAFFRAVSQ